MFLLLFTLVLKAYIVLKAGKKAGDQMAEVLKDFVKERLAKQLYPREIIFLEELPMTITGKVIRKELREKAVLECEQERK